MADNAQVDADLTRQLSKAWSRFVIRTAADHGILPAMILDRHRPVVVRSDVQRGDLLHCRDASESR